jgi:DNA-binding NarL/FixJ family response regulator
MDLILPHLNGIDATRQIIDEMPDTHVIALSACHTPEHVYRAAGTTSARPSRPYS